MIRFLVTLVAVAALLGPGRVQADNHISAPNVVFIMVDDMGYADLSLTGSRHIRTPNIDSIGQDGVWLDQGYSSTPICSPTRTALLTGNWAQRYAIGIEEPFTDLAGEDLGVPYDAPTIASVFRDRGYYTALVGKWHLGNPPVHGPLQHGYEDFFGVVPGATDYFFHSRTDEDGEGLTLARGDEWVEAEGYLTDLLGEEAVAAIDRANDRPFFLSLHFTAPHWPWEGREDRAVAELLPSIWHNEGGSIDKYREMLEIADENVGRVLAALEERGLADNTIVVFTSDNGAERYSESWPFVGYKGEVLEGGIRVPILVRWPARIAPGSRSQQVMASMDFLPTLLSLSGGDLQGAGQFDGADLSAQLLGQAGPVERTLYFRFGGNQQAAVRHGDWKYVRIAGNEYLFNLAQDLRERADRSAAEPETLDQLRDMWDAWNAQMLPYRVDGITQDNREIRGFSDRY